MTDVTKAEVHILNNEEEQSLYCTGMGRGYGDLSTGKYIP